MILTIDGFCIEGNADELVAFLRNYTQYKHSYTLSGSLNYPSMDRVFIDHKDLSDSLRELNNYIDHYMNDLFNANHFTNETLIQLLASKHLDKEYDLETLTREELIELANEYFK